MASSIYPLGLKRIIEEGIDTMTCKLMLVASDGENDTTYVFDKTHEYVNAGTGADNAYYCRADFSNYEVKAVSPTVQVDQLTDTTGRIEIVIEDQTWEDAGDGDPDVNNSLTGVILFDDDGSENYVTAPSLCYWEISATTAAVDLLVDFNDSDGNIRIPYTNAASAS